MARLRLASFASRLTVITVLFAGAMHLLALTCNGPAPDVLGAKAAWNVDAVIIVTASNFPTSLQPCVQKAFSN